MQITDVAIQIAIVKIVHVAIIVNAESNINYQRLLIQPFFCDFLLIFFL